MNTLAAEPLGRVERKRRKRREEILNVAQAVCADEGLAALTLGKVADELDYTVGALYRYFPSKDALIAELEARALTRIAERFADLRGRWEDYEPLASARSAEKHLFRLYGLSCFYVDLLDELPDELHLISLLMGDQRPWVGDDDTARVRPVFASLLALVAELFREAADASALAPGAADERTVIYWSSVQGIAQLNKLRRFHKELFDPRVRGPEAARALLLGWGADARALTQAAALAETWRQECFLPSH